jgi:hypothetical protein
MGAPLAVVGEVDTASIEVMVRAVDDVSGNRIEHLVGAE